MPSVHWHRRHTPLHIEEGSLVSCRQRPGRMFQKPQRPPRDRRDLREPGLHQPLHFQTPSALADAAANDDLATVTVELENCFLNAGCSRTRRKPRPSGPCAAASFRPPISSDASPAWSPSPSPPRAYRLSHNFITAGVVPRQQTTDAPASLTPA